jgi:hypothetical protein
MEWIVKPEWNTRKYALVLHRARSSDRTIICRESCNPQISNPRRRRRLSLLLMPWN